MPWPLERIIRQYVGFSDLVCREYSGLIFWKIDRIVENVTYKNRAIAQWRASPSIIKDYPYIYHFRWIFNKNYVMHTDESDVISMPHKFYKDNVNY